MKNKYIFNIGYKLNIKKIVNVTFHVLFILKENVYCKNITGNFMIKAQNESTQKDSMF